MFGDDDQHRGWCSVLLVVLAIGLGSCADDLYSSCQPDDDLGCDENAYSCVAEPDFQCSTQVCAKYRGGDTYCTKRCESDGDCAAGKCKRFILGREDRYCVPNDQLGGGGNGEGANDAFTG